LNSFSLSAVKDADRPRIARRIMLHLLVRRLGSRCSFEIAMP
jgi:hypothetical protein